MEKDQIVAFLEKATPEQLKAMSDLAEGKTPEPKAAAAVPAEPKVPTFAELVAAAEPDTRDMINRGLAVAREQKNATIKALKDTGRCAFSDEELAAMSQERLDQLTQLASVKVATDFGVNVPKQTPANEVKTAPAAPDLTERIKAAAKK